MSFTKIHTIFQILVVIYRFFVCGRIYQFVENKNQFLVFRNIYQFFENKTMTFGASYQNLVGS